MPEVSSDGKTIKFKIHQHYLEDIKVGRKKADVRKLDTRWRAILEVAKYIRFICPETGGVIEKEITNTKRLSPPIDYFLPYFFRDVDLKCKEKEELVLITWE